MFVDSDEWERVLKLIESNSRAIAALTDQVEGDRQVHSQQIQSNTQAISQLTELLSQLQTGQSTLTRLLMEQQGMFREIRQIIDAILERMERTQSLSSQNLQRLGQDLVGLQASFAIMQKDILTTLQQLADQQKSH